MTKESNVSLFRKAAIAGRKNISKLRDTREAISCTFNTLNDAGKPVEHELEIHLKYLNVEDYQEWREIQWELLEDEQESKRVMDSTTAIVIVGCLDADGGRIFNVDDAPLLECPYNATTLLNLAPQILNIGGVDAATAAAGK